MGDVKIDWARVSSDLKGSAENVVEKRRAGVIAAAAQAPDTFKGDLVADELHAKNEAKRAADAKVQASLDDKFGPSLAEVKSQSNFIVTERAELQRRAAPTNKVQPPAPLSNIVLAYLSKRKE